MIRPAYWTDADLHIRLSATVREFYIGLWMLADDAGYVAWDVTRVGAELYPFRPQTWRTRQLPKMLAQLGPRHARLLDCGQHVVVPNLAKFQAPPRPSYPVQRAHDACMRAQVAPAGTKWAQVDAGGTSTVREGKGKEVEGVSIAGARASGAPPAVDASSEFQRLVPRPGRPA